jgi:hypothetical protein
MARLPFVFRFAVLALVLGAHPARGEERRAELGLHLAGLSAVSSDGETVTLVGVPAPGLFFVGPGAYLSYFVNEKFAVEPQLGLFFVSGDGDSSHALSLGARLTYLAAGRERRSLYVFGAGSLLSLGFDGSETDGGVGGGVGFRFPVRDAGAIRVEGRYDHYFENDVDVFGFSIGLGLMF